MQYDWKINRFSITHCAIAFLIGRRLRKIASFEEVELMFFLHSEYYWIECSLRFTQLITLLVHHIPGALPKFS